MPRYMWFILATIGLIVGYIIYGKIIEKIPQNQMVARLKKEIEAF